MKNVKRYSEKPDMVRIKADIITAAIWIVIMCAYYFAPYIGHSEAVFTSVHFWKFAWFGLLVVVIVDWICSGTIKKGRNNVEVKFTPLFAICLLLVLVYIVLTIFSSKLVNAKKYSALADIETSDDLSAIPTFDDVSNISLMDTASAAKLGDRQLGKMSELVSQYEVDDCYYTISYQDKIYKIAPLEYGDFFKWMNNDTIPGYILVDTENNTAEYVAVDKGMNYSPSAYFNDNLFRYVQKQYPTTKFQKESSYTVSGAAVTSYSFQLDEDGMPYWVVPTYEYKIGISGSMIDGCVVVNAVTGETQKYCVDEIPSWVDLVFSGPTSESLYDLYGRYLNGYWNFSETGETETTDDYGYLRIGDDICTYTGVTSVAGDQSNVGFIICNSRTGVITYYAIDGAEEYSAMNAAEGMVQNYGYTASFPALVMCDGEPTYAMVLKDGAGLIKKYAMVNMRNYTIVVVGDNLNSTAKSYKKALKGETTSSDSSDVASDSALDIDNAKVVTDMRYEAVDSNVYVVVTFEDGSTETFLLEQ